MLANLPSWYYSGILPSVISAYVGESEQKHKNLFNILKPRVVDALQYCTVAVFEPPERMSKTG